MTTAATEPVPTPRLLWVVGILSLLWNLVGCFDYLMTQTRAEFYMSNFTPEQLEFFYGFPAWVEGTWAIAVWGALTGSVLLLLRLRLAVWVFLVSLLAMVLTTIHNWFLSNGLEIMGSPVSIVFSILIFIVAVALFLYTRHLAVRGVLR
jgi:hypothetical protein